jgi:hypothetical protein
MRTPGLDVTAYTTMVAYVGASFGRRLLNWIFSVNDSLSLIHQAGGGSVTMGLANIVFEVEGISEVDATCPSPVLSVGNF